MLAKNEPVYKMKIVCDECVPSANRLVSAKSSDRATVREYWLDVGKTR